MQQFSPQQHTAAPAAISSPQPSIQQPLLLSSPLFAEGFHSSTAVRSAAAASSSSPPDETFQAAVAAESLPSSATAAVAAAAEAQQQILLAALAAELRSAVDRWCPVGRAPRTGAAAPPPAAAACPVLRSATVSGAPAAVRLPHGREDEGEEDQLLQQHKPRSALELLAAAGGRPVAAALEASERVKGDSSSNSKGGGHVTWGWWHCSSAAPGGGRQEFFLTPAAAGLLLPAASETGISPLCCLWDKPPPRCLYTSVAVRVIMKSAVRLPTHLYREEAAIEEEDAAGLLGCLEEEGLSLGVEADVRGRRELVAALSYEEGGTCTRGVSSSPLTGSRESSWEAEATAAASPARQQTRPDKSSRGRAGGHGSSHSASSSSSSREDDASSHRWGEWPLSVPSSEDVQEVLTSSEEKAAAGGYLESGRAKCSAAAHTKASGRASLKGAASALSEISNFHTASAAAAEGRSSSQRRVGGSATSGATAAHAAAGAAAGGRRANVSCCWETPDTFFENTPLLEPEAQVPGGTARAAAAAAVAAPAGASAAGDPKLPLSPPPALAPLPALGAAAANGQQRLPCATAVEPPTAVGSALRGNNLKLSSVTTVSAAAAETGAGTVEGAAAFAAAAAAAVANGGSTSLASLLQGGLHTEKPAGSCRTAAAAAEGAREQQGREGDPYSDDCSGGAAAAAAATTGGGATGGGGSRGGEGSLLRRNHGRVAAAAGGSGVLLQERSTAAELSVNSSSSDQPLSTGSASFSGEEETPQYPQQAGETQALLLRKKNSAFPGERRGGHDKAAAAAANNSNDNGGASDITHHHHHPEIRNGGDGGGQWKAYDDGVRGEKAVREAADGGQDSERSADIHPAAAATTAAALGAAVSDEVARSQRKTGVHAATGDNVSSSQEIPASCLREASSEEARVEETAVFSEVPVKARSVAVAQNGQDRRLPAAGEIRPMMRLAAAGDLCRAASAPETAAESTRHSGRCLGSEKERWAAGTAEHVLLRNPAEAAAAAATKAAQAAAACRRRVFDLFSPVAPDGPADTSRPTTAATADDVHQFVYVWLEGCCRRLQAVAAESAADVALAKASENRQLRQQVSTASSSSSSSSPGGEEAAVTHVQGDEAEVLHAFLLSSKRQVKEELKAYDAAFLRRYGRVPGRPEKEPLHPLYSHYQLLRRLLLRIGKSVEEADPQTRARAYPAAVAAALRSCSDSGSGNITVRGEKENLRKKVADEKACDAQVTAEAAPLTAGDIPPPPSSAARDSITAARACTAPVAVDVGGENRRVAVGSKSLQSSGDDRARQDGHLLVRQKEQHCSPKAVAGTERADGAAALPVVEWSPGGVDGGSKGGGVFDGIREKHDACRGVQNKSNNSTIGRHLAADATAVVGVRKPFLATATGSDGGGEGERKEVAEMSEPKGNLFAPENWWQRSSDLRGRHNNRNAHPRRERTDKETDQPPLLSAASAAAVAGCNPASGRSVPSSPSVHLADSSSATDVSVQAHTFKSLTMSAETEISLGASPGLPVHSSGLVSESHVGRDNNCTMRQAVCQEFRSDKARVTVMRPVHQDRIQVIAGQSFSNVCAARRRDSEHCSVENSCVQDACEHHASGHHGKNKCQQGNKCDSPRSRDCRMRDASCSSQQYQQQSAGAPAQLNDIGVGNADAKELTVDVRSQLYRQDEVAAGKIHPYAGSEETSVCQPMKILTSGMTAPEVRKPQRRTELMRQSAGVHSQMESPHKAGLPFLANVATEYQQRLLRLQQEKRMLRTKLLAYQAEFTAETGRVVQLYKDIAPIEREYRRYKEVKQEIAMLIDKQCDSLFSTNESEARHQALEEDGIPSEKFEKGRPEVCAS